MVTYGMFQYLNLFETFLPSTILEMCLVISVNFVSYGIIKEMRSFYLTFVDSKVMFAPSFIHFQSK